MTITTALPATLTRAAATNAAATNAAPTPGQATLADVARVAGVSSATASRVLTGSCRVSDETRGRVQDAMNRLGYVRHRAARAAGRAGYGNGAGERRAGSVALIFCEENGKLFADPFFARMLWGMGKALSPSDVQLILLTLHSARDYHSVSRFLRGGHVDGALFVSMHQRPGSDYASLGIPVVLCGRPISTRPPDNLSYVDADNVAGAAEAVRYLQRHGRRTIATIAGPPDMSPGIDRLAGYRKAIGITDPGLVAYGDFGLASGEHAMYRLIDHRPGLDAVFVASDLMAAGALRALRRLGRKVPADVAVIGFDDSPLALQTDPRLTTMRQPVDEMAARMAAELLTRIADPEAQPVHIVLDTKLIRRDSA